jgi:hypothetical protein
MPAGRSVRRRHTGLIFASVRSVTTRLEYTTLLSMVQPACGMVHGVERITPILLTVVMGPVASQQLCAADLTSGGSTSGCRYMQGCAHSSAANDIVIMWLTVRPLTSWWLTVRPT